MPLFYRFLSAHACNALSIGIQMVLVAWIAAGVLRLPADQIGWVQAAVLVPNIFCLFWAGRTVDNQHPGRVLAKANMVLVLAHTAMFAALWVHGINLPLLMVYGLALGAANAFVQNGKEALVGRLASDQNLQQRISLVGLVQYIAQGAGIACASFIDWVDLKLFFLAQTVLSILALVGYIYFLRKVQTLVSGGDRASTAKPLAPGWHYIWRKRPVRWVVAVVGFNGLMHLGMFVVLLPLVSRQILGYSSLAYGMLQLSFVVGTVLISLRLAYSRPVKHPGQSVLFALVYTAVIGFGLSAGPTAFGLYTLVFCWGLVAGTSANLSRVVVQSLVPDRARGRVMAAYQLALFGMAPIGALLAGYLVDTAGVATAFKVIGYSSAALFAVSFLQRDLWGFDTQSKTEAERRSDSP